MMPSFIGFQAGLVERAPAERIAGLDDFVKGFAFAFAQADGFLGAQIGAHDFNERLAGAADFGRQPLADHPAEGIGQANADLLLLFRLEHTHDTVDGFAGADPLQPTILTATKPGMKIRDEEAFGPVLLIEPYEDFEQALADVNHSKYGLQAGLLTCDANRILTAYRELEVGALIVGDTPSWRLDPMPFGGVKESGQGREGIRYAIEEMTEPRMLVMSGLS